MRDWRKVTGSAWPTAKVDRTAPRDGDEVVASPCRNACTYDAARGLCLDCGRLGSEIAEWPTAGNARRTAIRAAATRRLIAG